MDRVRVKGSWARTWRRRRNNKTKKKKRNSQLGQLVNISYKRILIKLIKTTVLNIVYVIGARGCSTHTHTHSLTHSTWIPIAITATTQPLSNEIHMRIGLVRHVCVCIDVRSALPFSVCKTLAICGVFRLYNLEPSQQDSINLLNEIEWQAQFTACLYPFFPSTQFNCHSNTLRLLFRKHSSLIRSHWNENGREGERKNPHSFLIGL